MFFNLMLNVFGVTVLINQTVFCQIYIKMFAFEYNIRYCVYIIYVKK